MSTFVPAPNVCRFVMGFESDGRGWNVDLELGRVSEWPDGGGAMADAAETISVWMVSDLATLFSNQTSIVSITGQRQLAYAEPIYDFTPETWPEAGTVGAQGLPNNAVMCWKKSTGATGRSRRGRSYYSGVPVSVLENDDGGSFTTTYRNSCITVGQALLDTLSGDDEGYQLAVVSRFHKVGGTPDVPRDVAVFNYVTNYQPRNVQLYTKRKRMGA